MSVGIAPRRAGAGTLWVWPVGPRRVGEEGVDREAVRNHEAVGHRSRRLVVEARAGNTRHSEEEEHHTVRVLGNEPGHHRAVEEVRRTAPAADQAVVVHTLAAVAGRRCTEHEAEVHHMEVAGDAEEEAVGNIHLPVVEGVLRGSRSAERYEDIIGVFFPLYLRP